MRCVKKPAFREELPMVSATKVNSDILRRLKLDSTGNICIHVVFDVLIGKLITSAENPEITPNSKTSQTRPQDPSSSSTGGESDGDKEVSNLEEWLDEFLDE